ncbi:Retinoblastoma binding 6, partial [Brachionus plicatilis]
MSFIHYKLITNQNYEKIAFDGVSLSVGEIKKMVMEKKFRKHAPSAASSNTGNSSSRKSDVDLEVTNVDTNEVYKNDAELIPKNSRVQISRVVKNIGPAIAGGTITQTHKDNEKLADFRLKSKLHEKQARNELDLDDSILLGSNGSKNSDTHSGQDSPDLASQLYDDILTENGVNGEDFLDQNDPDTFTLVNNRIDIKIPKQGVGEHKYEQDRPPGDFLCPFDDGQEKHLMENAIIVPCCGYFICCEK